MTDPKENTTADEPKPLPKSFSFFRSYWQVLQRFNETQRHRFIDGMLTYAFEGLIPDFSDDVLLDVGWISIEPNISASLRKSMEGSTGGRPRKKQASKAGSKSRVKKDAKEAGSKSDTPIHSTPDSHPLHSTPFPSEDEGDYDEMKFFEEDLPF